MRAILTGATGFLGSHLLRRLVDDQNEVAIILRRESDPWRIAEVLPEVRCWSFNDANVEPLLAQAKQFAPDVVFHLAWDGVHAGQRHERARMERSVALTQRVVRLAQSASAGVIVGVGSQAEDAPMSTGGVEESGGDTCYAAGKRAARALFEAATDHTATRSVWIQLVSSYGPKDASTYLIPTMIHALLFGEALHLATDGQQVLDTVFCTDVASALLAAATTATCRGTYKCAADRHHTVREIVEMLRDIVDPRRPISYGARRGTDICGTSAALNEATGWVPQHSLQEGLARTVAWYRRCDDRT